MAGHPKWTPTEEQREEAKRILKKWRDALQLQHVQIALCYCVEESSNDECAACTRADTSYNRLQVCIHLNLWEGKLLHTRDWTLLHELLHYYLKPYRALCRNVLVNDKYVTWDEVHRTEEGIVSGLATVFRAISALAEDDEPDTLDMEVI